MFFVCISGSFLFWGCLSGQSLLQRVCETLQESGISPQQLLVSDIKRKKEEVGMVRTEH